MAKQDDPGADRFLRRTKRERDYQKELPGEDETPLPAPVEPIHSTDKPGRNAPCTCGSGKKYKQCCGRAAKG